MALISPGIQVTVTDQSNYSPAQIGTVPYILLATGESKAAAGGGIASGTLAENAGKLYAITSQRELVTTFGTPSFKTTSSGAQVNGSEQNEYGLLAAYSALGVSNQVFVQRADVNLDELTGSSIRPTGAPADGTYWINTATTNWGLYAWDANAQEFSQVTVKTPTSAYIDNGAPVSLYGSIGDYAVVATSDNPTNDIYYKNYNNDWVAVGSEQWQLSIPAVTGTVSNVSIGANTTITVNTVSVTGLSAGLGASGVATAINNSLTGAGQQGVYARVASGKVVLSVSKLAASNGSTVDGLMAISGTALADLGITADTYAGVETAFGAYYSQPEWHSFDTTPRPSGSIWVKTTSIGEGLSVDYRKYSAASAQWVPLSSSNYQNQADATYTLDPINGGLNILQNTVWTQYNPYADGRVAAVYWYRKSTGATVITGSTTTPTPIAANVLPASFGMSVTVPAATGWSGEYTVTIDTGTGTGGIATVNDVAQAILAANIPNVLASVSADGELEITHTYGGDIKFVSDPDDVLVNMGIDSNATNAYLDLDGSGNLIGTNWEPVTIYGYISASAQPYAAPADGTMWYYNTPVNVDIMINDGTAWRGYRNVITDVRGFNLSNTDSYGIQIQSTMPTTQRDGSPLVVGDLWLDTSDLENYPVIYRRQLVNGVPNWVLINNADNVSQNGIIFADARWDATGTVDPALDTIPSIRSMLTSDNTDLDCPDASLYPRGMLMFNTRLSGYNVKQYVANYFTEDAYPNQDLPTVRSTWKSVSGFSTNATVPVFGRQAQRSVVVAALKSAIDSSTALREEQNQFNLIACPGYPELIPNMLALNSDRNKTAFVIGDTPLRLAANGTDIISWAQNQSQQSQTNEQGLANHDEYLAVYYPSAQTNDLAGNSVVVPASHAMIRTYIRSDNASYPWFAPAGTRRGVLDNVNSVGYVDAASGGFVAIGVTQGLRDVLYNNQVNPLTYLPGTGLVAYGNKTLASSPSALDRINVARLINYIRRQLDVLARPYIFEPNDPITRNQIKTVTESLMNDLVAKRGISDYLVVCDGSNNTADRIARNELYVDVAIQPTKDVEFIYIPIRLKNPGELQSGNISSALTVGTGA